MEVLLEMAIWKRQAFHAFGDKGHLIVTVNDAAAVVL
jgi:hypothetical protein